MDENPNKVSSSESTTHKGCKKTKQPTKKRFAVADDGEGDVVECSGKYCKSCTTGLVADCVALCCCPCVVLHCFTLAFIKAPLVMARKCFRLRKKKSVCCHKKKKCKKGHKFDDVVEKDLKMKWPESPIDVNVGFEAEKVWHDLYQLGHLDFGRVL